MMIRPLAASLALCCLASACSHSGAVVVTSADSFSGVTVSENDTSRFVSFTGVIAERLYTEPRAACHREEALAYVASTFSGQVVSVREDGLRRGEESFESMLVRAGYAIPDVFAKSVRYDELQAAADEARKAGLGIWQDCPTEPAESDTGAVAEPVLRVPEASSEPEKFIAPIPAPAETPSVREEIPAATPTSVPDAPAGGFTCDPSRRTCKAMKSCAEAKYYLANCGTKSMDGDKDGVPCEALCKK